MSNNKLSTLLLLVVTVHAGHDIPEVSESWIYTMIVFGFIGLFIISAILSIATYKRNFKTQRKSIKISRVLTTLNFVLWISNIMACFEWAFFRTSLFITLTKQKCVIIYISNYLFYMLAKYCLHILLLYRLYIAFRGSALRLNIKMVKIFCFIITINFIVFTSLWIESCLSHINIGIIVPSQSLEICTLYNNDSNDNLTFYQKVWPLMFGGQDFCVGIFTLILFIYKIIQYNRYRNIVHDVVKEKMIRKLCILGTISIISTFILFTFAIPFFANLTFLLPIDATLNSLCVFLLLHWSHKYYIWICCGMDKCLQKTLKHEIKHITSLKEVISDKGMTGNQQKQSELELDGYKLDETTNGIEKSSQMMMQKNDINDLLRKELCVHSMMDLLHSDHRNVTTITPWSSAFF